MVNQAADDIELTMLFDFPEKTPEISCAAWSKDYKIVITGHKNGFLAIWDINKKVLIEKYNFGSEIESIAVSSDNKVLIGCYSGDIFLSDAIMCHKVRLIKKGENDKFTRIWQLKWIDDISFIASSTFGKVFNFTKSNDGNWQSESLIGHTDSVFGLDFRDGYLATGDYRGLIVIWKREDKQFVSIAKIRTLGVIESIKWKSDTSLSAVTYAGHVYYIEYDSVEDEWSVVFDAFVALGRGRSIEFANLGQDLLAITGEELLHIGLTSQQVKKHVLKGGVAVNSFGTNAIRIVSQKSVIQVKVLDIVVPVSLIKYKFAKVSLIGHTGVGKSTLCDTIIGAGEYDMQSTYGKKVWEWKLNAEEDDRRIMFHDHGGQVTVMYTFLPFISDSDVLLLLFTKTDSTTFSEIESLIPKIRNFIGERTKVILVETKIDQLVDDVPKESIERLTNNGSVLYCLRVSATNDIGVEELKNKLANEIPWDKARVIIRSVESENALSLILELQKAQTFTLPFDEVHSRYNQRWLHISKIHLGFLLSNFSNEGIIEYYPDASKFIIFGGNDYWELRSKIPIFAYGKNGIVSIDQIMSEYPTLPEYVRIIDSLFQQYKVHIRNGNLRIYPELLRMGDISLESSGLSFGGSTAETLEVESTAIKPEPLIEALSDMELQCADLTANQGLFRWENNAYLYYIYQPSGDHIRGLCTKFTFYLGGNKEKYIERLRQSFITIVEGLYGPRISGRDSINVEGVKKNEIREYDVAISYASQQRDYVTIVATSLKVTGIKTFFAPFLEIDMWGRNTDEYLEQTYFSKAKVCVMFISKEYAGSEWCKLESRSAFARQRKQGLYILPIRFDDTELHGLDPGLHYLTVESNPPEVLSSKIILKLEREGLI